MVNSSKLEEMGKIVKVLKVIQVYHILVQEEDRAKLLMVALGVVVL